MKSRENDDVGDRWREAIERWRALPPEERRRLHQEAIPRHVANSMAMEGEPVDEEWIRERLARRRGGRGDSQVSEPREIPMPSTQTSHRHPNPPRDPRGKLLLRRQDPWPYIRWLLDGAKHYFLARPRRFGKSLFLDTCKELFEGNEPLFEGLGIHEHWDWTARHPVVRLDFSSGNYGHWQGPEDVRAELAAQLSVMEDEAEITPDATTPSFRFGRLLEELHERTGRRVAVLVDEYEKPVLDNLDTPETAGAPSATTCSASTRRSSPAMPTSASALSPGSTSFPWPARSPASTT